MDLADGLASAPAGRAAATRDRLPAPGSIGKGHWLASFAGVDAGPSHASPEAWVPRYVTSQLTKFDTI